MEGGLSLADSGKSARRERVGTEGDARGPVSRERKGLRSSEGPLVPDPGAAQVAARRAPERRALERVPEIPTLGRAPPDSAVRVPPRRGDPIGRRELERLARLPAVLATEILEAERRSGRATVALVVKAARATGSA